MFAMSEEAYAEYVDEMSGAYAERCKQTELDALREDHFDYFGGWTTCADHEVDFDMQDGCPECINEAASYPERLYDTDVLVEALAMWDEPPF